MKLLIYPALPSHTLSWLARILPRTGEGSMQPGDTLFTDNITVVCFCREEGFRIRLMCKCHVTLSYAFPEDLVGCTKDEFELWLYKVVWRSSTYSSWRGLRYNIIGGLEGE